MKKISIENLIWELKKLQKAGKNNIEVKGTLMCEENGNSIIVSTEKQM